MELFTKIIETERLKVILEHQLNIPLQKIEVTVFKDIPSMNWIKFTYKNIIFQIYHHMKSSRYGFEGSLLKLRQENFTGKESDLLVHEEVINIFSKSLGGILDLGNGTELEGFDSPGTENSKFVLEQLYLKGISDNEICDVLEKLEQKKELVKKSNC